MKNAILIALETIQYLTADLDCTGGSTGLIVYHLERLSRRLLLYCSVSNSLDKIIPVETVEPGDAENLMSRTVFCHQTFTLKLGFPVNKS
jgi:hypothetical protein